MSILSKGCKPDNSLNPNFNNITGIRSNFLNSQFFLESNSPDILTPCGANLNDSIDSGNFSVMGYLLLIRKDSVTHIHSLAVYKKQTLPFARDLSLQTSADLNYVFDWLYFFQFLTSFSSIDHLLHLYARFFIFHPA